jgi:hypothetical protein
VKVKWDLLKHFKTSSARHLNGACLKLRRTRCKFITSGGESVWVSLLSLRPHAENAAMEMLTARIRNGTTIGESHFNGHLTNTLQRVKA